MVSPQNTESVKAKAIRTDSFSTYMHMFPIAKVVTTVKEKREM